MEIIYEDNHLVVVCKASGEIVQGDKTGDTPLSEMVKAWLKEKYHKPGAVFLGVPHRLDRPVSGLVVFARTSKALSRLCSMFASGQVRKTYWAVVERGGETDGAPVGETRRLDHWLTRREQQNKSYVVPTEREGAKRALLDYRVLRHGTHYNLVEVTLLTGRHHQIRCQLAAIGSPIQGDLKYGARRSNRDGSISLQAHRIAFEHPVSHQPLVFECNESSSPPSFRPLLA